MKIINLDKILYEIGDFGRTKNDILDNIFLVSLRITVISKIICCKQTKRLVLLVPTYVRDTAVCLQQQWSHCCCANCKEMLK